MYVYVWVMVHGAGECASLQAEMASRLQSLMDAQMALGKANAALAERDVAVKAAKKTNDDTTAALQALKQQISEEAARMQREVSVNTQPQ